MRTEQLTVKACEVRVGDVIEGHTVTRTSIVGGLAEIDACQANAIRVPQNWQIVVSRPLPDPCPRGRMVSTRGHVMMEDSRIMNEQEWFHVNRRLVALWNAAEREPYRTTEEIEAGLGEGK